MAHMSCLGFLVLALVKLLCAADISKYQGSLDLQCSYVCVPKAIKVSINGSLLKPNSCNEVVINSQSKVIVNLSSGLQVMCDTETDGGGWLVIQRRINGKLNFYRGWEDYKKGFGDYVNGEFYLGNENIHRIATNGTYELKIDFDYQNGRYSAQYSRFYLFGESEGYKLHISGYSGNAGYSLSYHNDMKFTTYDKDLDLDSGNCAVQYQGAWWYNACHYADLNGLWGSKEFGKGLNWQTTTTWYDSVSRSEMKIRKVILKK